MEENIKLYTVNDVYKEEKVDEESRGFKYTHNNEELKNDEGETITKKEFDLLLKGVVTKFINRSFNNIILLAGAGASVVMKPEGGIDSNFGKTVQMLGEKVAEVLSSNDNVFTLDCMAELSNYNINNDTESLPLFGQDHKLNNKFNLEDFLSHALSFSKFINDENKAKYIFTLEEILRVIVENTKYNYDDNMKHGALINILSKKVSAPNKLSIVTTNYDTLFEDAAEKNKYTVMDGFSFSHSPYFDSDMFDWNLVKEIPNVMTNQVEYKDKMINLLKIHGSLTWEKSEERIRRKYKSQVEKPIMIFPSSDKYMQSYQEPYFELFTKFQELLKSPNTLLITTGFSFADDHISSMIFEAIKRNKGLSILVTDFNINQQTKNWNALVTLMKGYYPIMFLEATLNGGLTELLGG